ncbi:MAG: hypothetical protein JWN89_251 [Parcubacteria group bacterium]|nr:hypothetical protein [Parcubacteria group bacterium]
MSPNDWAILVCFGVWPLMAGVFVYARSYERKAQARARTERKWEKVQSRRRQFTGQIKNFADAYQKSKRDQYPYLKITFYSGTPGSFDIADTASGLHRSIAMVHVHTEFIDGRPPFVLTYRPNGAEFYYMDTQTEVDRLIEGIQRSIEKYYETHGHSVTE